MEDYLFIYLFEIKHAWTVYIFSNLFLTHCIPLLYFILQTNNHNYGNECIYFFETCKWKL